MQDNPLKLRQIHHVEFWVGNAKQAAFFYRHAFGFSQVAYSGLETGHRAETSYALEQGRARFVLTTPLTPDHPAADHIRRHGDDSGAAHSRSRCGDSRNPVVTSAGLDGDWRVDIHLAGCAGSGAA